MESTASVSGDYHVHTWSAANSLLSAALVIATYLLLVLKILPAYMKNRQPYQLKRLLMVYNAVQVIYSAYLVAIYSNYMWKYGLFPMVCPKGKLLKQVANDIFPYFLAKQIDLLDTVFFVLRKKDNQVTFLHVYHHSIMVTWGWLYYAYHPSDHFVFVGMLNSLVHVIMYAYYGLSTLGPHVQKYLWWKKHLTKIQLIQFILVVLNLHYQQKWTPCPIHNYFHYFSVWSITSFFVLFMNFYLKSYVKQSRIKFVTQNGIKTEIIFPKNVEKVAYLLIPREQPHIKELHKKSLKNYSNRKINNIKIMEEIKDAVFLYEDRISLSKYSLMQTISGAGVTVAVYLMLVLKLLPAFMMNRKPFAMKRALLVYNASQVAFSAYMLYIYTDYILRYGLFPKNCPQINPKFFPVALYNVSLFFIAKHVDLLDTVFFILRKKYNQVSFLHIYHHSMMILWAWISYVYIPTDHFVVTGILNSFVHVLMYTYYGISSLGPQYAKYIWWKKHLTKAQLVQFVLGVTCTYYQQKLSPCPMPEAIQNFVMFFLCSFFILFMEFYFRSYRNRQNEKHAEKVNKDVQSYIQTADEIKKKL